MNTLLWRYGEITGVKKVVEVTDKTHSTTEIII